MDGGNRIMKKQWGNPLLSVNKIEGGGAENWTGDGSGQSSPDDVPWDYETWSVLFEEYDGNDDDEPGTWEDYEIWMHERGFDGYIRP